MRGHVRGVLAVAGALAVALLGVSVARYLTNERRAACFGMVYNLAMSTRMYLWDWQETPNPRAWSDQLAEYMGPTSGYRCPNARGLRCAYAFNSGVAATATGPPHSPIRPKPYLSADPDRLITIFESDRGWNAHGGRELLPRVPRHMGGDVYGFLEGDSDWVRRGDPAAPIDWGTPPPPREGAGK